MIQLHFFTFNPFQENSYVLWDETMQCVIIDPGCCNPAEEDELQSFIENNNLRPVALLNTHCHLDHILGNHFVAERYKLVPKIHPLEKQVLASAPLYAPAYGVQYHESPLADEVLEDGGIFNFGNSSLSMILAPGHSPGSICFYAQEQQLLIGGDVLFRLSIGRSDLPGGNASALLKSIRDRIFVLPDEVKVYPGHGEFTTIGFEKKNNPFLTTAP